MGFVENRVASELAQWSGFKAAGLTAEKISESLARPPKADMGDLAFATFRYAKEAAQKPNEFAAKLIANAPTNHTLIDQIAATGPYVNVQLNHEAITALVLSEIESPEQFGDSTDGNGKTLVVDLSSPNIAKPLAVHHLRSTMIGYSIKKLRESQGWVVVGVNHLGDWGTGFGKLIAGLKRSHPDVALHAREMAMKPMTSENFDVLPNLTVKELNTAYQQFNEQLKDDETLESEGKREFALLEQNFVAENTSPGSTLGTEGYANFYIYRSARHKSLEDFARVYRALGMAFEPLSVDPEERSEQERQLKAGEFPCTGVYIGESHWAVVGARCDRIVTEAFELGAAEMSDGAVVMWVAGKEPDKKGNVPPPLMLQKNDGASSYHLRDIASATYRHEAFDATELTYVVGGEQKLHFKQLFRALEMLGHSWASNCTHTDFGLMLFKQPDGAWAKGSTRKGTAIMLEDLLDESVKGVREIMQEKNPELAGTPEAEEIAQAVGVGAVVFNDLKNGRRNNVKFDWEAVLDFQGESGPYMQMQYVRMGSVTEKFEKESEERYGQKLTVGDLTSGDTALLTHEEEWKIVQQLAAFPDAVAKASADFEPSIVARYLIELASLTSTWWTVTKDTRIVGDDKALSLARVRLVNAIRKVLGRGLTLLGMKLVERM